MTDIKDTIGEIIIFLFPFIKTSVFMEKKMSDTGNSFILKGKSISPGLAEGLTFLHRDILRSLDAPTEIDKKDVEEEFGYLEDATTKITGDLIALSARVENEMDSRLAAIFDAHQLMLNDLTLREDLRHEIRVNLVSASSAVKSVFLRWEKRFLLMESQISRQKGEDIRDISNRLSNALSGITGHPLEHIPKDSVLVTKRLLPSDTIFLSRNSTVAVLLEYGGYGSHTALFVREMGIPCIADITKILTRIPAKTHVLVDANKGEIIIAPDEPQKTIFRQTVDNRSKAFIAAHERAQAQAITKDGVLISVLANVGSPEDTKRAIENGADGVGLFRIEKLYMGRTTPPNEQELIDEIRQTLEPSKGKPVCVRLLDIGADKPLPFIGFLAETNPALGRRGIRLLHEFPNLMETQLHAFLKLSGEFDLSILVPMVTLPEDIAKVKECLLKIASKLQITALPRLGSMIETPAAALSANKIKPYVDFLSFGTNDLTQYSFAADRENAAVEQYFNDSSDVIFRLLKMTLADVADLPLSICGELAGREEYVEKLLQCGIKSFSVAPPLIPIIKETIRDSWCNANLKV
ncbi:MAG: hypothetical protein ACD_79C00025G0003 [uncultured bacterium]|nr:MAG: hypothetical protein ACD_79C00025G0003 [uncultured bacterium]